MKYFQKLGMPTSKMMLGLGTYGRGDTPAMPYTGFKGESGFVAYYEVTKKCRQMRTSQHEICSMFRVAFKSFVRK